MWHTSLIKQLTTAPVCGYQSHDTSAAEPTALSALALAAFGQTDASHRAARWLAASQATDGSVSVRRHVDGPRWPTSLSVLAWHAVDPVEFTDHINLALDWILATRGKTMPWSSEVNHNPTLAAWPWVTGTHAWIEPTALHVLALKAVGLGDHPRTREAVRMLVDRQIPGGGCNYGNTGVLGQWLRPHVQPTGLALWALGGETLGGHRIRTSIAWLRKALNRRTTSMSLAWGLLGLAAHHTAGNPVIPEDAFDWLAQVHGQHAGRQPSSYQAALLLMAADAVTGRGGLGRDGFENPTAASDPGLAVMETNR